MAKGEKVFVGLSGGVDSALSAALLIEQGYDVTGVFIKIWQPAFTRCTWKEDRLAAMRVAVALGIPFATLDLSDEYEREVIGRMQADYRAGRTPNPDALCNRFIKFGAFRRFAALHGADLVATGHHAQIEKGSGRLLRGADPGKDQAYFLWQLTRDDLLHALMPIGGMTKQAVREAARTRGIPVAERPDSQGLCFVGDIDMHGFLSELLAPAPGMVLDAAGAMIGTHDGAALYTLGARHKFRITDPDAAPAPLYVIATDVSANTITVAPSATGAMRRDVALLETNWCSGTAPQGGRYLAEVRYHQEPQGCTLEGSRVIFDLPQLAVPGQSLVLYDGAACLGGGIISA
ncbi:MAG TPA: tRNA 2-thiouridine(34) synthase MnmA [Candidatus Paceibacterota bacterium]|nr:tRNA 2-thiouridine(34) synthase MnmA [Candidatus Paceibacterota bacterium]